MELFKELWRSERDSPEKFWDRRAEEAVVDIYWFRKWDRVFEWSFPKFTWFRGGKTNVAYNCLDYKLERFASKPAYIYENPELGVRRVVTYREFYEIVKQYAAALRGLGVGRGDRIMLYLPNSIEAAALILAAARIGAISVTVFAGFSPRAVADRIELTTPKLIFTQDVSMRRGRAVPLKENVDAALSLTNHNARVVVKKTKSDVELGERDMTLEEFLKEGQGESGDYVEVDAADPHLHHAHLRHYCKTQARRTRLRRVSNMELLRR